MIEWQLDRLEAFDAKRLYAIFSARAAVFVVEQNCAYQDMDGLDLEALHLVAWSGMEVAAYLRLHGPGVKFDEASMGRVMTAQNFRATGLGRTLVSEGLAALERTYPQQAIRISAQAHLESFYASFGFVCTSAPYLEDGIPHLSMQKSVLYKARVSNTAPAIFVPSRTRE